MPLGNFCEHSIQLRRLIIVLLHRLFSMSSEAIFIQGIHVDWRSYTMYSADICILVQRPKMLTFENPRTVTQLTVCRSEN